MTHIKAVVTMPFISGLPEDVAVNTFHFDHPTGVISAATAGFLRNDLADFYNNDYNGVGSKIAAVLSQSLSRVVDACMVDVYESAVVGGPFGSPKFSIPWTLAAAAAGTTPYPAEVAITASFAADLTTSAEVIPGGAAGPAGDTHPRARRRGRIFLGPMNTGCAIVAAGSNKVTVHPSLRTNIVNAMDELHADPGTSDLVWSVYSPTDAVLRPVVAGWVDDAFDTQRRRGERPSTRTALTF